MESLVLLGFVLTIPGLVILYVVWLRLGGARRNAQLRLKDERRHAEQLDWRRTAQLPVRYVTTYEPGEMVDEDMARMLELGYYVAEQGAGLGGELRVVYRLQGVLAL
jgi:hypothetical protein